ncbi:MAG: cobalamin-dependent protein [Chloroflexota bacterium]|nr:cobalamin-dependent protein [Chloroflexota bacterium]
MSDGSEALAQLNDRLLDLDMEGTIEVARSLASGGYDIAAKEAIAVVSSALATVGKRFQSGEWYLVELVYAGEISSEVLKVLSPLMTGEASDQIGTIVVGTVAGDLHDLGKNIFINHARSVGFNIIDLGIDVPTAKFIAAIKEHKPDVLGMSCIMTTMTKSLESVVRELEKQLLRDSLKIIIGGAAMTDKYAKEVGVDAFAPDAVTGTDIVKGWMAGR